MDLAIKITIGFGVGTLIGMTGLGGGVLLLPLLIFGLHVPAIVAVGSDALFNFLTKIPSSAVHLFRGTVRRKVVVALAVGSVSLFDAVSRADHSGEMDADTAGKLLRYRIRMATRPTPYGMFAGVALARWGKTTDLTIAPGRPCTRTRPDRGWLLRLVLEAESRTEVRTRLRYFTNPRAYFRAGRVFLPEAAPTAEYGVDWRIQSPRPNHLREPGPRAPRGSRRQAGSSLPRRRCARPDPASARPRPTA